MYCLKFELSSPAKYNLSGKFTSLTEKWKHNNVSLSDFELILVTEGVLYIESNNTKYEIKKGEYILLYPPTQRRGYKESSCSFYWLHFSINNYTLFNTVSINAIDKNSIIIPTYNKLKKVDKILILMKQLQDSDKSYKDPILNSYMTTTILCEIYNQLFKLNYKNEIFYESQIYNDILDYVKYNINTSIKVCDIANYFGYNEKYLSSSFKKITGLSLKQYILNEKIELSKFKLCDTNDTISRISYDLGFQDTHHFMKTFKRIPGLTPSTYRNTYSKRSLFYT